MTPGVARSSDVVVVGAGPAGLAAAIELSRRSLSVQIVERHGRTPFLVGETLPGDARTVLDDLGMWPAFCRQGHLPSAGNASAWGIRDLARSDAFMSPLGGGWHIDRLRFQYLVEAAARAAGAEVLRSRRVVRVRSESGHGWLIDAVGDGATERLRARALVDATGARATVARWLGGARCVDDRMVCAYTVFASDPATLEGRTVVESVPEGWWYAAPIPGERSVVAVFSDPSVIRAHGLADPQRWSAALGRTAHVARMLPMPTRPLELRLVAVTSHCLVGAAGPSWVAVGDAAASVDPLASSGLTTALRDGQRAASALAAHLDGHPNALSIHNDHIRKRFDRYRAERAAYYALEGRWPTSPFWRSRQRHMHAPDYRAVPARTAVSQWWRCGSANEPSAGRDSVWLG